MYSQFSYLLYATPGALPLVLYSWFELNKNVHLLIFFFNKSMQCQMKGSDYGLPKNPFKERPRTTRWAITQATVTRSWEELTPKASS